MSMKNDYRKKLGMNKEEDAKVILKGIQELLNKESAKEKDYISKVGFEHGTLIHIFANHITKTQWNKIKKRYEV